MKKVSKYCLLICLIICMALAGTACGKKNTNTIDKDSIYREEDINLNLPQNGYVQSIMAVGDKLLINGYSYNEEDCRDTNYIMVCNTDGTGAISKNLDFEGYSSWVQRIFVTDDGKIYVFVSSSSESWENDEYSYTNWYTLRQYDSNLNLIKETNISDLIKADYISNVYPIQGGRILVYCYDKMAVLDSNMNVVTSKSISDMGLNDIYTLKNGRSVVYYWGDNGMKLAYFDTDKLEIGEKIELPFSLSNYSIMEGTSYDLLLLDNLQIYGYNIGDASPTPIMNFINSDLSTSYFSQLIQLEDGSFIGTYYDWYSDNYSMKSCRYTKVAPEDVVEKKILTLGTLYLSWDVRKSVIDFNKSNDEYRISIVDYSSYNTDDNYEAGKEKMNSDIASGQSPDIIVASNTATINNYVSKGLFIDLYKYMDADPEINREDIFPNLLEACSYNGKLYSIVPYFEVQTIAAKTSVLNGKTSWTMQEMMDFANNIPEGSQLFYQMTRNEFLSAVLEVSGDYFVNTSTGKCNFDSEEFIKLLEFCKTMPEEVYNYDDIILYDKYMEVEDSYSTRFRSNKVMLEPMTIYGFYDYKYTLKGAFGEDITFIGYPTTEGSGSAIRFDFAMAISSKCADPEGAWQFIRYYLTPECQSTYTYYIPASMSVFDSNGEKYKVRQSYEWEGETYYEDDYYWIGNETITLPVLDDADISKLKNHILETTKLAGSMDEVITIIDEEAQAFFEGQKSAADVAKIIQSRATIYINEKQ